MGIQLGNSDLKPVGHVSTRLLWFQLEQCIGNLKEQVLELQENLVLAEAKKEWSVGAFVETVSADQRWNSVVDAIGSGRQMMFVGW